MYQVSTWRFSLVLALAAVSVFTAKSVAQDSSSTDDPNEVPLGDVARNLRSNNPAPKQVIDNDNLSEVVNPAKNPKTSVLRFLMAGDDKKFQLAAPDVTCSLSFTAGAKALLSQQYAQMALPASDLAKLSGPASIEGDAFTVSLFNGTEWHISEIDVAFTLVNKTQENVSVAGYPASAAASLDSQAPSTDFELDAVRPERKPDRAIIYKMRAAAPPFTASTFSAQLDADIAPGQEWHWAILEAKGYPPQNRTPNVDQTSDKTSQEGPETGVATLPQASEHADPSRVALSQPQ